jgi:hypothetical protein
MKSGRLVCWLVVESVKRMVPVRVWPGTASPFSAPVAEHERRRQR